MRQTVAVQDRLYETHRTNRRVASTTTRFAGAAILLPPDAPQRCCSRILLPPYTP